MLSVRGLHVRFGEAHILQGVDLEIGREPVAIVGRNGMGKTTLCQTIMGMIRGEGEISFDGASLIGRSSTRIARAGIALVPQGRRIFPSLTVHEHLRLVARGAGARWTIERAYDVFPRLAERRRNAGSQLSGGEQQMLAIARALLMNPRLVVMDEPSEGLAPVIVDHLVEVLRGLVRDEMGLLLVEQNLRMAAAVSDTIAVMVTGRIAAIMPAKDLVGNEQLQQRYLGVAAAHH